MAKKGGHTHRRKRTAKKKHGKKKDRKIKTKDKIALSPESEPTVEAVEDEANDSQSELENQWNVFRIVTVSFLILRLVFLIMHMCVFIYCLFDNSTTVTCETFGIIPLREVFEPMLLGLSVATTSIWFYLLHNFQPKPSYYQMIFKYICGKFYFAKFVLSLLVLLAYHFAVAWFNFGKPGSYIYITLPFEEISSTTLMFVTNFLTGPSNEDNRKFVNIQPLYRAVLIMIAVENSAIYFILTTYKSLKILTLPVSLSIINGMDSREALNVFCFLTSLRYRYRLVEYFIMKVYLKNENVRILRDVGDSKKAILQENE